MPALVCDATFLLAFAGRIKWDGNLHRDASSNFPGSQVFHTCCALALNPALISDLSEITVVRAFFFVLNAFVRLPYSYL